MADFKLQVQTLEKVVLPPARWHLKIVNFGITVALFGLSPLAVYDHWISHSVPVAGFGDGMVVRRVNPGGQPAGPGGSATVRSR